MSHEPDVNSRGRKTWRIVLLLVLGLAIIHPIFFSSRALFAPIGDLGFSMNGDRVVGVVPSGSAAAAGLHVGDRIDLKTTSQDMRPYVGNNPTYSEVPGMRVTFAVAGAGAPHFVTMVSRSYSPTTAEKVLFIVGDLAIVALVSIGTIVVLLRPSLMTWGFYWFAILIAPQIAGEGIWFLSLPVGWEIAEIALASIATAPTVAGSLLFALRFPHDAAVGWRREVERFVPLLLVVGFATDYLGGVVPLLFGVFVDWLGLASGVLLVGVEIVAISALISTYLGSRGEDRQRIKWALLGLVVGLGGSAILYSGVFSLVPVVSQDLVYSLEVLNVLAPLAAAYAILRNRIIDVNFVISRALVYGVLTAIVVGVFALIDWLFSSVFANARFGLIAEITAAVAIGFWLNGLHVRIDRLIDTVLFRDRHKAELRLARVAGALPHAIDAGAVDAMLVGEPVATLRLASGAVFKRDESGCFTRAGAEGWPEGSRMMLGTGDPLVLQLQAEQAPLRLSELRWARADLPQGRAEPVIALPIIVRRSLAGILLYGAHVDATDVDPDEVKVLASLATSAAAAYDHIEAETLRRENAALQNRLDTWARALGFDPQAMPTA